ncbi:hypothetical protein RCL_jg16165.t1 [Rhizophagus clarus]|uniref:Uncharacterized protein n=1 Tax=Rhizophagus clarus TaxID=94130 RepID=A0A8H3R0T3_9GLOM|nr:hypothetical protein RCL_jg16165.t1 [Rhizophagus clarus]
MKFDTKLQAFSEISSLELDNYISETEPYVKLTSRFRISAIIEIHKQSDDRFLKHLDAVFSKFSSFSWDRLDIGDSVVIISKVWTWILIISQVSDGIPAGKSASLKPDKLYKIDG